MPVDQPTFDAITSLNRSAAVRAAWLIHYLGLYGAHVHVTEGRRTIGRQRTLFAQGRTAPGPVVTWTLASRHLTGRAFDIDFVGVSADQVPDVWWDLAGRIGEWLGLRWGGRWAVRDLRHFEY
jgi:peptidoglycan L-alanyl-D-glutamate endopeptidase CwlK